MLSGAPLVRNAEMRLNKKANKTFFWGDNFMVLGCFPDFRPLWFKCCLNQYVPRKLKCVENSNLSLHVFHNPDLVIVNIVNGFRFETAVCRDIGWFFR